MDADLTHMRASLIKNALKAHKGSVITNEDVEFLAKETKTDIGFVTEELGKNGYKTGDRI